MASYTIDHLQLPNGDTLTLGTSDAVNNVYVNGISVVDNNKIAQVTSYKEVTQAQYNALPSSKLTDGVLYCIKDGSGGGGSGSGGGINYSTTEQDTGLTWIDGRPVYQKTYYFGTVAQGVSVLDNSVTATLYDHIWQTDIHWRYFDINIDIGNHGGTGGAIYIESYNNQGLYAVNSTGVDITDLYFTIRYTKTADL